MIKLFDTHTHYDDSAYDHDRNDLINDMLGGDIAGFISIGCNMERSLAASELSKKFDNVYASVGIHPGDTDGLPDDYIAKLSEMCKNNGKITAIGEIGLDYYYDGFNKEKQKKVFKEQLELAKKLMLPVIVHSRDATRDTIEILDEYRPKAVMHCFSGSAETVKILINMGILISFTGVLTFKNAKKAEDACKTVPADMLMLETDCPYMAPSPFRGKRCDSRMAWYTAQRAAQFKRMTTDDLVKICNENAKRFFNINF